MKNKKIILGLGTITALGAMSVGFIACVKKKEIEDMNLSKLTKEEVAKLLEKVSTLTKAEIEKIVKDNKLTEAQLKKLISENKDSKLLAKLFIETNKEGVQKIITKQLQDHLNKVVNDKNGKKNSDIGHSKEGSKESDLVDKINTLLESEGWEVSLSDEQKKQTKETKLPSSNDTASSKEYKLKKTVLGVEIETNVDISFNFFVGKYDIKKNINSINKLKGEIETIADVIKGLNDLPIFKNIEITSDDVEVVILDPADTTKSGKIKIKTKDSSNKVKGGEVELTIPKFKKEVNSIISITDLGLFDQTTNPTALDIIGRIKEKNKNNSQQDNPDIASKNLKINNITETGAEVEGIGNDYKGKVNVTFSIKKPLKLDDIKDNAEIQKIKNLKDLAAVNEILEKIKIDGVTKLEAKFKGESKTDVTITITINETKYKLEGDKTFVIKNAIEKTTEE